MGKFFKKKMLFFSACAINLLACIFILFMASPDAYAATYSAGQGSFSLNNDNSVTATFNVTSNDLNMRGWLLMLYKSDPGVSPQNNLAGSGSKHPYYESACAHYYFVSNTAQTGSITVTWAANSADQKSNWQANGSTSSDNNSLGKVIESQNWYIVIGPRHYNTGWGNSGIGRGQDGIHENCDFYVGRSEAVIIPTNPRYTVDINKGTGVKSVYISTSSTATSGSTSSKFEDGTTVYGFAELANGYNAPSGWTKVSGTPNTEGAKYRIGSWEVNGSTYTFGTVNAEGKKYNIIYKDQGGSNFSGTHALNYPDKHTYGYTTFLKSASKAGYDFAGWYTTSSCSGSAVSTIGATAYTSDITLYAKWTPKTYAINYKDQGNVAFSGTHASGYPTNHTYNTATTLKTATKTGYDFAGWYTNSNCTGTAVTSLGATAYTSDITLYAKWTLKPEIQAVINKINNIGTLEYTDACKEKIDIARSAYNDLNSTYKGLVSNYQKLLDAEEFYDKAKADEFKDAVDTFGKVYFPKSKDNILALIDMYEALTDNQLSYVSNDTKTKYDTIIGTYRAKETEYYISKIGDVNTNSKPKIDEALNYYNNLTDEEKELVSDDMLDVLMNSQVDYVEALINDIKDVDSSDETKDKLDEINDLINDLTPEQQAQIGEEEKEKLSDAEEGYVEALIDEIGNLEDITYSDDYNDKINKALDAYNNLTDEQKNEITNKDDLLEDKNRYDDLAMVDDFINKIDNCGDEISYPNSKNDVEAMQEAYDALTDEQKALIPNDDLEAFKDINDEFAVDECEYFIGEIDTTATTDEMKDQLDAAYDKFNNLTDEQKEMISPDKVEELHDDTIGYVEAMINDIGEIKPTDESKQKIQDAEDALKDLEDLGLDLTNEQKDKLDELNDSINDAQIGYVDALIEDINNATDLEEQKDKLDKAQEALNELKEKDLDLTEESQEKLDNTNDSMNDAQIDYVKDMIDEIGDVEATDASKDKIDAAQNALEELKDLGLDLPSDKEKELNDAQVEYVEDLIAAIGEVEATDESKDKIDAAQQAYADLQDLGLDLPRDKERDLNNAQIEYVNDMIDAIGEVEATDESKDKIDAAQNALEDLKDLGLTIPRDKERELNNSQVEYVKDMIDAIGEVEATDTSKDKIDAAQDAYDELKDLGLDIPKDSQKALNNSQVEYVEDMIDAIGDVEATNESKDKIEAAEAALKDLEDLGLTIPTDKKDELDEAQIEYVEELFNEIGNVDATDETKDKIEAAEKALEELKEKDLELSEENTDKLNQVNDSINDAQIGYVDALIADANTTTDLEVQKEKLDKAQDALDELKNKDLDLTEENQEKLDNTNDSMKDAQIDYVNDMIEAIGEIEPTDESKQKIQDAEEALKDLEELGLDLTDEQKEKLDELNDSINDAQIGYVDALIEDINNASDLEEQKEKLDKAQEALNELKGKDLDLTEETQEKLDNTNDSMNEAQIDYVKDMIAEIGDVEATDESKEKIDAAQQAYEDLKDLGLDLPRKDQKDLNNSQKEYVEDLINDIDNATDLDDKKDKIEAAEQAVKDLEDLGLDLSDENQDKLNEAQVGYVNDLIDDANTTADFEERKQKLEEAEKALEELKDKNPDIAPTKLEALDDSMIDAQVGYVDALIEDATNTTDLEEQKEKLDKAQEALNELKDTLSDEDQSKLEDTNDSMDAAQISYVEALIDDINNATDLEDQKEKVEKAQEALEELNENNLDVSGVKKDVMGTSELDYIEDLIADIANATDLEEQKEKIDAAQEALDNLKESGVELSETNEEKLNDLEALINKEQIEYVEDMIAEIGVVEPTNESKALIDAAQNALKDLEDLGLTIPADKKDELDEAQIEYVEELFNEIGNVDATDGTKDKIDAAEKALQELGLVLSDDNTTKLNDVIDSINNAEIGYVDALIADIDNATDLEERKQKLEEAEKALEELKETLPEKDLTTLDNDMDDAQVDYVDALIADANTTTDLEERKQKLEEAEKALEELKEALPEKDLTTLDNNMDDAEIGYVNDLIEDANNTADFEERKEKLEEAEMALEYLKEALPEKDLTALDDSMTDAQVGYVNDLIDEIGPVEATDETKDKIDAARDALNNLTEEQKEKVDSDKQTELENAQTGYVDALIEDANNTADFEDRNEKLEKAEKALEELKETLPEKDLTTLNNDMDAAQVGYVNDLIADANTTTDLEERKQKLEEAEKALEDRKDILDTADLSALNNVMNQAQADYVNDLIDEIGPVEATDETKDKIDAAQDALNNLTEEQKEKVDSDKRTELENAQTGYVNDLIEDANNTTDFEERNEKLEKAEKALEELKETLPEKDLTTLNNDMDAAQVGYVNDLIDAIGPVEATDESKDKIDAAQDALNNLTEEQKEKVDPDKRTELENAQTGYVDALIEDANNTTDFEERNEKLEKAEKALEELKETLPEKDLTTLNNDMDDAQIGYVDDLIADIEKATNLDEQKEKLDKAQEALNELKDKDLDLSDVALEKLEDTTDSMNDAQVDYVKDMIDAIGEVDTTNESKDKIDAAQDAYDALKDLGLDLPEDDKGKLDGAQIGYVDALIEDIKNNTGLDNQKDKIDKAQEALDELKDKNLELSEENTDKLNDVKDALDKSQIDYVNDKIEDANKTTDLEEKKQKLAEAEKAYDELEDLDLVLSGENEQLSDNLRDALDTAFVDYVNDLVEDAIKTTDLDERNEKLAEAKEALEELKDKNIELSDENEEKLNDVVESLGNADAKYVEELISEIENATDLDDKKEKIEAAEKALEELQKSGLDISDDKKNDLDEAQIDYVSDLIDEIGNVDATDESKEKIEAAEKALEDLQKSGLDIPADKKDNLNESQIDYVDELIKDANNTADLEERKQKLEEAEKALEELQEKLPDEDLTALDNSMDNAQVGYVEDLINEIGNVDATDESKEKIDTALEALNNLTDEQKAKVNEDKLDDLTDAQVGYVDALIADIDTATDLDDQKAKLDKAQQALSDLEDVLPTEDLSKLDDTNDSMGAAQINYVNDLIAEIGVVDSSDESKEKIDAAQEALENLQELGLDIPADKKDDLNEAQLDYVDALVEDAKNATDLDDQKEKLDKAQEALDELKDKDLDLSPEDLIKLENTNDELDDAQVKYVEDLIAEIGIVDSTDESKEKIDAAQEALENLKELGLDLDDPTKEADLNKAQLDYVDALVEDAKNATDLDDQKEKLDKAQEALDELKDKDLELSPEDLTKLENTNDELDDAQVKYVEDLIDEIGTVKASKDSKGRIDDAQEALDNLTDAQKENLDPTKQEALENAHKDYVDKLIDAIGEVDASDKSKDKIDAAEKALEELQELGLELDDQTKEAELNKAQKDYVEALIDDIENATDLDDQKDKLEKAQEALEELQEKLPEENLGELEESMNEAQAGYVNDLIEDANNTTDLDEQKEKIEKAQEALDKLTDDQKELVDEDKVNELSNNELDIVDTLIDDIDEVTYSDESKEKIEKALEAYNNLSDEQKEELDPEVVEELNNAMKKYDDLEAVNDLLEALEACGDTITYPASIEDVEAMKEAYDKLTDDQKALIPTDKLEEYNDIIDELAVAECEYLIDAIGTVKATDESKEKIDAATEKLKNLTDDQIDLIDPIKFFDLAEANVDYVEALINNIGKVKGTDQTKGRIEAAEKALEELNELGLDVPASKTAKLNKAEVDYVIALINGIGTVTDTAECKDKIDNALDAYNALDEDKKALVTNIDVLENAIYEYDVLLGVNRVIDLIEAIGELENTKDSKDKVKAAKTAYDKLTDDQKATMPEDVLKVLNDDVAAYNVIDLINAIGELKYTKDCKAKIDKALDAYDKLTDDQKALVVKSDMLTKYDTDYNAVDDVVNEINSIGNITYDTESKSKIDSARKAENGLTAEQKKLLPAKSEKALENYEVTYSTLEKIYMIGNIEYTHESDEKLKEAQEAYNALTPEQKKLINETDLGIFKDAVNTHDNMSNNYDWLLIILLSISSLALSFGIFYLISLIGNKNKKSGTKVMSIAPIGLLVLTTHFTDPIFIALYIIAAAAVFVWLIIGLVQLIRRNKK